MLSLQTSPLCGERSLHTDTEGLCVTTTRMPPAGHQHTSRHSAPDHTSRTALSAGVGATEQAKILGYWLQYNTYTLPGPDL